MRRIDRQFEKYCDSMDVIESTQRKLNQYPDGMIGLNTWNAINTVIDENIELRLKLAQLRDELNLKEIGYLKEQNKELEDKLIKKCCENGCDFCRDNKSLNAEKNTFRLVQDLDGYKFVAELEGFDTVKVEIRNVQYCPNCGRKL